MDDNTQTPLTDDQVQGDQAIPATPATPATPAVPVKPVVEEPGVEESVPAPASSDGEPEEEESFEDTGTADTTQA